MNKPNLLTGFAGTFIAVSTLTLAVASSAYAQSGARIDQLERDVLALQQRILKLEAALGSSSSSPQPATSGSPWKSLSNWRQLKSGMGPNEVRALLGEPDRITGGNVAYWYYPGDGTITFTNDKVSQWN